MLTQEKKKDTAAHKHRESGSLPIARGLGGMHSSSQAGKCSPLHPHPAHLTLRAASAGPGRLSSHLKALAFLCRAKLEASCPPTRASWHCFRSSSLVSSLECWAGKAPGHCQRLCPFSEKLCANPTAATHLLLHDTHRHTSGFLRYWLHSVKLIKKTIRYQEKCILKDFFLMVWFKRSWNQGTPLCPR